MIREHCSKIGYITKPHGIGGMVIVRLDGAFAEEIEEGDTLFVETDGTLIPFLIEEIRPVGETAFIKFEFCDSEKEAGKLRGLNLFILNESIGDQSVQVIGASLFIGYRFTDVNSGISGIIEDFINNPSNPLFLARIESGEIYIPFQEDFVVRIDRRKKILHLQLPEGLTDL